ncbi:hypothetical protein MLD38_003144 [Melastoma candidum]|uniref:Uncharacterized protein n=1 Tax=Melastoma candidum TaxID=119954 RepID=A0ACB9S304_9MYRT|nr:hypothetical protein MLD38_003144 [Melastoma candidum]
MHGCKHRGVLIAANVNNGNRDVATHAAQEIISPNPSETSEYVLKSNVHSVSQQYEDARERSPMRGGS